MQPRIGKGIPRPSLGCLAWSSSLRCSAPPPPVPRTSRVLFTSPVLTVASWSTTISWPRFFTLTQFVPSQEVDFVVLEELALSHHWAHPGIVGLSPLYSSSLQQGKLVSTPCTCLVCCMHTEGGGLGKSDRVGRGSQVYCANRRFRCMWGSEKIQVILNMITNIHINGFFLFFIS